MVLGALSRVFEGLDPKTHKVLSYPRADRFWRDGMEDTRDPHTLKNILLRGTSLYKNRFRNMAMPPGINNTNPPVVEPVPGAR